MNKKVLYLIFLCFLVSSSNCIAQDLVKGSYNIGFKYYKTYDVSRQYNINKDTISRPLLIHFWYPSQENTKKGKYYFKNYIDLISIRENFNKPTLEIDKNSYNFINAYAGFAKQRLGLDTNITTKQILEYPVIAQYDVPLAKLSEKFPLIIYAPSNSKSAVQNHLICEYLASHGYMVISVGSAGPNSINRGNNQESILAQVDDMEFILNYFEDSLKIKYASLGLMGFSSGGLATAIFQMKNKKVKAVFSMDGSQEYGSYIPLFKSDDFNLKKANVPYCLLYNNYENFSVYPFFSSIVSKEKYRFKMPYLDHNGFVSYWRFFDLCSPNSGISKICSSYDYISSTALTFFNKCLNISSLSNNKSVLDFQTNEYIIAETTDNSAIVQFGNSIITHDTDFTINFLNDNQEDLKTKENEINILSKMIRDFKIDAAIQLLVFNVKMHPNSWQAHFELGFTYKLNGKLSLAKESLLKAQELNPENNEIIKLLNELNESEKKQINIK